MKILGLSIIIILASCLVIVNNNVFADNSIKHVSIDGHVTPKGCSALNGTVTQAKDIQNTTVQICNFSNKHFKLTEEWLCFASMEQSDDCDLPITCGAKETFGLVAQGDKIPINEGAEGYFYTVYSANLCVSEAYNEQDKKITIIANGSQFNLSNPSLHSSIDVLIPNGMLENITYTVDGKYPITFRSNDELAYLVKNYSGIEIDLPYSFDTKKIEIMGNNKIPEFPLALIVLVTSFSFIILISTKLRLRF